MARRFDVRGHAQPKHGVMKSEAVDGSGGWMVAGTPMRILKSYHEWVDAGHRL
jgi:hypothetical protein